VVVVFEGIVDPMDGEDRYSDHVCLAVRDQRNKLGSCVNSSRLLERLYEENCFDQGRSTIGLS
jgi:hypothetical protein